MSAVSTPGGPVPIVVDRSWVGAPDGSLANPTLWLGIVVLIVYGIGVGGYLTGVLGPLTTVMVNAVAAYLAFTVLHEGTHGTAHQSRLVNRTLGRITALPLLLSLPVFRAVHHEHHSHTNDAARDPDFIVARAPRLLLPLWCLVVVFEYRLQYFRRRLWRARGEWAEAIATDVAFVAVVALAIAGGWFLALLTLWLAPAAVAVLFLAFAFDFLPHYPYDTDARYFDTRAFPGRLLNVLFLGQNYHVVHHLWTAVPWYRYQGVFREIRPALEERGARVGWQVRPLAPGVPPLLRGPAV